MTTRPYLSALGATFVLALVSCSSEVPEPAPGKQLAEVSQPQTGGDVSTLEISMAQPSADQIAVRARSAVRVLLGKEATVTASTPVTLGQSSAAGGQSLYRVLVATENSPDVRTVYESRTDSLEVVDLAIRRGHEPAAGDVTSSSARNVFARAYEDLAVAGLVNRTSVPISGVTMRERWAAEGTNNQITRSWVAEYQFFVPLSIGGIPVGNETREFGVGIGVHRTGKLARIKLEGCELLSGAPGTVTLRGTTRMQTSAADAVQAAQTAFPGATVRGIGLRYVLAAGTQSQALAPRQLVRVARPLPDGVGRSKELVLSYATDAAPTSPVIWPVPGTGAPPGSKSDSK